VTAAAEDRFGWGLATVAPVVTALLLFPAYWMVITALQGDSAVFAYPPRIWPTELSTEALWSVFSATNVGRWLFNTTIVAGVSTLLVVPVAALTAYALSRFRGQLVSVTGLLIVVSQMMPPVLLLVPYFILFRELGLLDGLLGLILANFAWVLPVSAWLMKSAFDSVPPELEEAALIDGCTRFSAIWRIALPLALPGIAASAVFAFVSAWDEYFFARTLIADSSYWVVGVGLGSFVGDYSVSWQHVMAVATISTLPPAILFMLVQRAFVSNLSAGAVKG
jgi:multiple sugar transport system permease protein